MENTCEKDTCVRMKKKEEMGLLALISVKTEGEKKHFYIWTYTTKNKEM